MCVLAFAWRAHPRWRLVLVGNRDEFHARPAQALARWERANHVLAGRDLQSGGSWLGVSEHGRLAVVTNVTGNGPQRPDAVSRGALVRDVLVGEGPYADPRLRDLSNFNPFNSIIADLEKACLLSNRPMRLRQLLPPGIYGMSNGRFDEPWPKALVLGEALGAWISSVNAEPQRLLERLRDERICNRRADEAQTARALSPIFIRNDVYGTRCSTVVAVDSESRGLIIERRFGSDGALDGETVLDFTWPLDPSSP
jgi:uncharacterized protein with NRDE domain